MSEPIYFEEPPIARRVFASTTFAWLWLLLRLYLGWEWLVSGWGKTFGGSITWKFWNWGDDAYSLTGTANCGWIRSCTVDGQPVPRGAAVQGFAAGGRRERQGSASGRRLLVVRRLPRMGPRPRLQVPRPGGGDHRSGGGRALDHRPVHRHRRLRRHADELQLHLRRDGRRQPAVHHHLPDPDHGVARRRLVRPRSHRAAEARDTLAAGLGVLAQGTSTNADWRRPNRSDAAAGRRRAPAPRYRPSVRVWPHSSMRCSTR